MNASQTTIETPTMDRRALLIGAGAAVAGLAGFGVVRNWFRDKSPVFIAAGQRYDKSLERTIRDALVATGVSPEQIRGKRVLLKPNLVEPTKRLPHMTTHPAMVQASAAVFRGWGADVIVGEGPGHVRDTEMALLESRMSESLDEAELAFADLNYEEVRFVPNAGKASKLDGFYFPRSVIEADLIVSMPKMKTHHWVGFTASMKNLYGTIPGIKYGWPKNVLHHAGIPQTVFDINASLPKTIAIVDGIECMEGDGPIMGSAKQMGLVIVGTNPTAVDATVARIMDIDPAKVSYLGLAADRLGPIAERWIEQRGERWQDHKSRFEIIDAAHLKSLRPKPGWLVT
ncbi:MAG: DUF362 domain-containing protein [Pirellulales bacterium]